MTHVPKPDDNGVRYYGRWAGHPAGHRERPDRCVVSVSGGGGGWSRGQQCSRPRGHGPDGLYCKQHDPAAVEARNKERDEDYRRRNAIRTQPYRQTKAALDTLKQIADGHNDARALAADLLARWNEL